MFERFTDRSRRAVVLAQEEARLARHPEITCQHVLLGLAVEGDSIAGMVITKTVTVDNLRDLVGSTVEPGRQIAGHLPFTADAKLLLHQALRESLQLGHNYIAPEHILLAMLRPEPGDQVDQVLAAAGLEPEDVRRDVIDMVTTAQRHPEVAAEHDTYDDAETDEMSRAMRARTGRVDDDRPLVAFLYLLARDHLPTGVIEEAAAGRIDKSRGRTQFTNGHLARWAQDLARRLS